eukprot:353770-Chlamydomonas_euryale.AAC.4
MRDARARAKEGRRRRQRLRRPGGAGASCRELSGSCPRALPRSGNRRYRATRGWERRNNPQPTHVGVPHRAARRCASIRAGWYSHTSICDTAASQPVVGLHDQLPVPWKNNSLTINLMAGHPEASNHCTLGRRSQLFEIDVQFTSCVLRAHALPARTHTKP